MLNYIKKIKILRKEKPFSICLAESCTGGMISSKLTSVSGSSDFFDGSVISYSNDLKNCLLKVPKTTINKYGAVSHQTALSMVKGLKKINKESSADLSTRLKYMLVAVDGDSDKKNVRAFVDNEFLARDSRAFRIYLRDFQPDVDMKFYPELGPEGGVDIPIGVNFLWPDAAV